MNHRTAPSEPTDVIVLAAAAKADAIARTCAVGDLHVRKAADAYDAAVELLRSPGPVLVVDFSTPDLIRGGLLELASRKGVAVLNAAGESVADSLRRTAGVESADEADAAEQLSIENPPAQQQAPPPAPNAMDCGNFLTAEELAALLKRDHE